MQRPLILVAALAVAVAACSSADGAEVASLDGVSLVQSEPGEAVETNDEDAILAFAACMRENGIEDFEDPDVSADGNVQFRFGGGGAASDVDRETVQAARELCSEYLDGLAFGPGGGDFDETERQDQLLAFAECMRAEGIDMDDPDLSGGPGGGGLFGDVDLSDPDAQAALEVCQAEFGGQLRVPGAGGGGRQGGRPGGDS